MASPTEISIPSPSGRTLTALVTSPGGGGVKRCAVIQIHGGAWQIGAPTMLARRSAEIAGHGYTAVAIEYRLLGEAPWPAQIHDVKRAIRHVRANAGDFGVDPDRIVVEGHSAGAHLALLAAGTADRPEWDEPEADRAVSSAVAAVVAFYPPTDLRSGPSAKLLLGERPDPEVAAGASPVTHVHQGFPPTMLLHGTADAMVPPSSSETFHRALQEAGGVSELHLYAGQIHEFDAGATLCALTQHEAAVFYDRYLIDAARFEAEQVADNPVWGR
jgi:acetyl esterase/lipase